MRLGGGRWRWPWVRGYAYGMINKREIRQAAARLRGLGKVVPVGRSDDERLREAQQAARNEDIYDDGRDGHDGGAGAPCPACAAERQRAGDATALCAQHLSRALGF